MVLDYPRMFHAILQLFFRCFPVEKWFFSGEVDKYIIRG